MENIPIVPLYFAAKRPVVERDGALIMVADDRMPLHAGEQPQWRSVRFRTLGCYPLTGAMPSTATTLPDIVEEMLASRTSERQGRVIDRDRLMRDVDAQFRRLGWHRSRFVREKIEFDDERATEILVQTASVGSTALLVLHRVWDLTRRGRYVWGKQAGRWQIEEVEVLQEQVSPGRFHVGFRADRSA